MNHYTYKSLSLVVALIALISLALISCSSNDETGEQESKTESTARPGATTKSDFFADKPDLAMTITPGRMDATYDFQETVDLSLEMYSPRFLTYETYQKTLAEGIERPDLTGVFLGSETNPWSANLSLFSVANNLETPVPFALAADAETSRLNVGSGEIGALRLLIKPGHFSDPGSVILRIKYQENDRGLELTAETSLIVVAGQADEASREVSTINYLIAEGKTKEALDMALEAVQKRPESYQDRVLLGKAQEASGHLEEALKTYRYGMALFKDEGEGHVPEAPKGLWWKIEELETKLGK